MEHPINGHFTANHLCRIHQKLLGDVYPFAGHYRREDIAKDSTRFLAHRDIPRKLSHLLQQLHDEKHLIGLERSQLIARSAYMAELNYIHPFREKEVTKGDANISTFQPEGLIFYALFSLVFEIIISNQHTKVDASNTS